MKLDLFSDEYFNGAWDTYRWLREEEPVHHDPEQNVWILSRYADVHAAFRDWETFSSARGTMIDQLNTPGFTTESMAGTLFLYDPPAHSRLRRLVSLGFTPKAVGGLDGAIERAIDKFIGPIAGSSNFDLVDDFAKMFPAEVMFDLIGVPDADRPRALRLFDQFMYAGDEGEEGAFNPIRMQSLQDLAEYFGSLVERKRAAPAEDIVSLLIEASYVDEGGVEQRLTAEELGGYLIFLTSAGVETTAKLLTASVVALQRNPDQWQKILADPSKIPAAIEEGGRYEAPVQYIGRKCVKDATFHGVTIPADSNVLLLIGAANRDPRAYDDPDSFEVDRSFANTPITYGFGQHICLGVHLARREAQRALAEIAGRWPDLGIDESGLVRTRSIHMLGWSHVPVAASATQPGAKIGANR